MSQVSYPFIYKSDMFKPTLLISFIVGKQICHILLAVAAQMSPRTPKENVGPQNQGDLVGTTGKNG